MASYQAEVFADNATLDSLNEVLVKQGNLRWLSVVTAYWQPTLSSDFPLATQNTASDASLRTLIQTAHASGVSVMLKPHVDVSDGSSRNFILPGNFTRWFENYSTMMVHFATLAQEEGVELFCVGTELALLAEQRLYWNEVIRAVRGVYSGPLTYAAIFWNYKLVSFWDLLDFVGIDAYFTLTESVVPSLGELEQSWARMMDELRAWRNESSTASDKEIIFTEVGYPSIDAGAILPWAYLGNCELVHVNQTVQAIAYESLYGAISNNADLVTGVFLWWWDNPSTGDYVGYKDQPNSSWACFYTPDEKLAFDVMADAYALPATGSTSTRDDALSGRPSRARAIVSS